MKAIRRLVIIVIGASASLLLSEIARSDDSLWIGVFESVEGGNFLSPAMASPHVRVVFKKNGVDWAAAGPAIPETMTWTVVLDGRALGTITSATRSSSAIGDVNTQVLTTAPADRILVRRGVADFQSTSDVPVKSRPLILVSEPHFRDPEGWKPTQLTTGEKNRAVNAFRERIPTSERCDQPEEGPVHKVPYADAAIRLLKAYRSRSGNVLLGMRLDDKGANCDFFDDENFYDYWFLLQTNGAARLLDSQMTPMDAVDLDNSGKSEWIFRTSRGEDREGYELFYDDFSKRASFSWTYH